MKPINREEIVIKSGHVVVLKGGMSPEREISLQSGDAVFNGLQRLGIKATLIDVDENVISALLESKPDLVFNMLHGQGGEDGLIQGLLETMQIAYTGSNVLASALAMDKVKSKKIWKYEGLSTPGFELLSADSDWQDVIGRFGSAVVKPVNGGSSLGISIVDNAKKLQKQYEEAVKYDSLVMAEEYIEGKEFSVGLIEGDPLPGIELETSREFFDYEAKYIDADTRIICPPRLSEAKYQELNALACAAYESLGCEGLARVDVMQDRNEMFYLLEINTVPGMTDHSFVPIAAKQVGIDFDNLLLQILDAEIKKSNK